METAVVQEKSQLSLQVAEEIRAWMGRRRLSGAKLAKQLGVSAAWVSYRLTGVQPIDLNDLDRIARVLDVDVVDLLPRPGRTVVVAGEARRQTTVPKVGSPVRPGPFGHPKRTSPKSTTRRVGRLHAAHALSLA